MDFLNRVFQHSCETMPEIPDGSVHCCVTSPPYYALRDYGVDGQIGMEDTLGEYIERMVSVFREVRRVLRDDGLAFLNLGDSYFGDSPVRKASSEAFSQEWDKNLTRSRGGTRRSAAAWGGLKPKDLMMVPHRVAIALQQDGWYVRDDIVWHKPAVMPSPVRDRCTPAKEYVFQLAKSRSYYANMDAVRGEQNAPDDWEHIPESKGFNTGERLDGGAAKTANAQTSAGLHRQKGGVYHPLGANLRNVWTIATEPYSGAHFATMPRELVRRCILIGSPSDGIVLDPFMGSGTVAEVALGSGRKYVGYELNPEYHDLIRDRLGLFGAA